MRVLVVDDDAEIRRIVRRSLEREGFEVSEAGDAPEALRTAEHTPVDVAVLDLHLPGASGLELLSDLRRHDPDLHVIMLTGAGSEADRVLGLVSGADDYMVKPFSARELAARVIAAGRRRPPTATVVDAGDLAPRGTHRPQVMGDGAADRLADPASELTQEALVVIVGDVVVHGNAAALALMGATDPSQLEGHLFLEFVAPQSLGASMARQQRAKEGSWPRPELITVRGIDGREVLVEVASMPVLWDGQPASQVTLWDLSRDTSKLRELATGIRTDVAEAVLITDTRLRIQSFNPAAEILYGWREEEVVGRSSMEVLPWLRDDSTADRARVAMERHGHWQGEVVQRRRDGTAVTVRSTATMLRDSTGRPVGIISVNRPVSTGAPAPAGPSHAIDLDDEIRRGIEAREFTLHYQPVVRLLDGEVVGVEALVRWQHPERGLLPPAAFIDAAERSGAIVDLGQLVLDEATRQWADWRRSGIDLHLAVNLSGRQLADPNLIDRLAGVVTNASMPPTSLWIEVTETSLVEDLEQATRALRRMAELGANVSIDDFGTGWASLTYLREFPVHALKIDRVFVDGLGRGITDTAIVSSIISLGAELGLSVVAEGIETASQLDQLQRLGCELGQGYLFARPQPPDVLELALHG